jgi:hypothetical protein
MSRRLLERDRELATLLAAARDAASSAGSVVLLHGEAAIGKTSLYRRSDRSCTRRRGFWSAAVTHSAHPERWVRSETLRRQSVRG